MKLNVINQEKNLEDTCNNIARMEWQQLLILQVNLSEHILNMYEHAQVLRARTEQNVNH